MSYLMSIFLGLVQGVAEFLPISSSGHLSIMQNIFGLSYDESGNMFFNVLLHLGTLIAVFVAYRKDIMSMITETLDFVLGRGDKGKDYAGRLTPSVRTAIFIVIGTLPLFLILPFYDSIEELNGNVGFIAFALLITGTLLFVNDRLESGRKNAKTFTVIDAIIIGIAQAVATIPGLSRSGTTITVATARGLKRDFAVRFSFLLSIPAVIGAFLLEVIKALKAGVDWSLLPKYLVGMLVAGVSGYFSIILVKKLAVSANFSKFAYYCWAVGLISLVASFFI